jgi:hypothetical protein
MELSNDTKYPNGISLLEKRYNELCNTPSDINEHLPVLHAFASMCSHITEMGVRDVVSTYALMMGMPKTLVSYDINMIPENEALALYDIASLHGINFSFICQDVLMVEIEPTEMLFIDTLHTYTQLKREMALHAKKVSKYLVFHDTTTYGFKPEPHDWQTDNIMQNYVYNDKGLWPAIEEFLQENKQWKVAVKLENNNGLTILKKW